MDVASENSEEMWTSTTFRPQIMYDRKVFYRVPLSQLHPNMLFGDFFFIWTGILQHSSIFSAF